MKLKNANKPKKKLKARPVLAVAFVLLISAAAYTDYRLNQKEVQAAGEYLYTATKNAEHAKILGEAAFVDSTEGADVPVDGASYTASYDTYFSAMQIDRQRSRDEAIEMLQTVADSADSLPDTKEKAYNEMIGIAKNITVESNVRSMVMAKGFEDCLAVINGDTLNVIVKSDGLLDNEVAQIKEIAMNETGFSGDQIRVVEKGKD